MNSVTKETWREKYLTSIAEFLPQSVPFESSRDCAYWSLVKLGQDFDFNLDDQPFVIKIFLENVMRHVMESDADYQDIVDTINNLTGKESISGFEFSYFPSRVLMQDYTGVPALADLAAMREAVMSKGGDANKINPVCPVDLVIDHSVIAEQAGSSDALLYNRQREMEINQERYQFLKWAQKSFNNLRIVPPGRGICHQVNLEYLAQVVRKEDSVLIPDTLIGTDSHTTMINGLGVLGWGVGGIEAEAVMLGQPLSMSMPQVVGVQLKGKLPIGTTATDLVLTITKILRQYGVVGKYVEFYGAGVLTLSIADRATIANMAPEYGATCGLFPIDAKMIDYLTLTNRPPELVAQVEAYAKAQHIWFDESTDVAVYTENVSIDLQQVVPSVAGPKRPQDLLPLSAIKQKTLEAITLDLQTKHSEHKPQASQEFIAGDIAIAAITSCTNTSNPNVMLQAGLLAKAAVERGLTLKSYVKTSFAPGSQVVARYLDDSGLQPFLDKLGFHRIGFGCTTCIGNSGPLNTNIETLIDENGLSASAVLSGNRNFEGRIHPAVKLNWLASPPLVVAFALAGHTRIDLDEEPLGTDQNGKDVYLRDIWPSDELVTQALSSITQKSYAVSYQNMLKGDQAWEDLPISDTLYYPWNRASTYIKKPPFFELLDDIEDENTVIADEGATLTAPLTFSSYTIKSARLIAILGHSITTDHISPAGKISEDSPSGQYLLEKGVLPKKFNSYGSRRGNHEVMVRGTFANNRLQNKMVAPEEGGVTYIFDDNKTQHASSHSIFEASQYYQANNIPLVIFAGKEYGTGSSRDWAAKGCQLLGVKAVIAQSFERIHRSNLVGMGIMPLQLPKTISIEDLALRGDEKIDIVFGYISENKPIVPKQTLQLVIRQNDAEDQDAPLTIPVVLCINNSLELKHFLAGGLLPYIASKFL
ncbi:aconitate hydratase AcnA [Pseudocolwellia sp. HL-MZ7]|uniref:aconitate hydratase AcnA n=1 Tax=Pseudocolwellia sp. HL-MZ7 TaxID=3400627 RepID=UPI003CEB7630